MDASVIAAARFDPIDEAGWRKLAERALKGADFDETLTTGTDDGFRYGPIYRRRSDAGTIARAEAARPWRITQRLDDPDTERAGRQASGRPRQRCRRAGAGDERSAGGVRVRSRTAGRADARKRSSVRSTSQTPRFGSRAARPPRGHWPTASPAASRRRFISASIRSRRRPPPHRISRLDGHIADIALALKDAGLPGTVLQADGRVAHNAGASDAQELAFILSSLTALARACEAGGMAFEDTLAATGLCVAVDQQQFCAIAKLRALRLLHARLQRACGIELALPARIHAETSYRMLSRRDPETNILRSTIAAFAAGVGGADSIAVLPHTLTHGLPDAFARRVARNTQVILIHESHLDFVGGSVRRLRRHRSADRRLCEAAWREFQAIEAEGGIMASLSAGSLPEARGRGAGGTRSGGPRRRPPDHRHDALSRGRGTRRRRARTAQRDRRTGRRDRAARWPPCPSTSALEGDDG